MRRPTTNQGKTRRELREDLDAQNREEKMSAEVVGIERSEDRSENSFQPQAVSGRRRPRHVEERRLDRHESMRAT